MAFFLTKSDTGIYIYSLTQSRKKVSETTNKVAGNIEACIAAVELIAADTS